MLALHLIGILASVATATAPPETPRFERGESVEAFMHRYDAWVDQIPADQRAWDKLQAFEKQWHEQHDAPRPTIDPEQDDELARAYGHLTWSQSVDFVRNNPQLIEHAHSIASSAELGMPAEASWSGEPDETYPPAMLIMLPQLMPIRAAASIVIVDLWLALDEGDTQRLLRDMVTIERLAALGAVYGTVIEHLVYTKLTRVISQAILHPGLNLESQDRETLKSLLDRLRSVSENEATTEEALHWEHVSLISYLDWFYEGADDGRVTTQGALRVLRATDAFIPHDAIGLRHGEDPDHEHASALRPMLALYPARSPPSTPTWPVTNRSPPAPRT